MLPYIYIYMQVARVPRLRHNCQEEESKCIVTGWLALGGWLGVSAWLAGWLCLAECSAVAEAAEAAADGDLWLLEPADGDLWLAQTAW